jgi:aspartyl-tRNA(Asn)/glutamyl-tRNA(Gln) amidotransferase subunit B
MSDYVATIGIECHVQLKTKTKLFSAVANDAREAPPNTLISHIDLGMPGALPVLNEAAVELAIKAAYALNTTPQKFNSFDRKHYFYPDLPSGYQITQFAHPIILGGHVDVDVDGEIKRIGITRAHLEADAGKSTHPAGKDYSLVDLNRVGTPLLEIVSEPDMHSAAEAKAYAHELYLLMRYADVSDANLYYGNMRFDVNVSVSKDSAKMGTRTETKNLNSFRSVEKAVEFEIARQTKELEKGNTIVQETRGWDDAKQKTFSQRTKEDSHDYRYFPDPDIPPVVLDDQSVKEAEAQMPALPNDYRRALKSLKIDPTTIENIVSVPDMALAVKELIDLAGPSHARRIAFWLIWKTGIYEQEGLVKPAPVATLIGYERMIKLSKMVEENKLNSTAAKDVFYEMISNSSDPEDIAVELNLVQVSDEGAIAEIVKKVLADNAKAAEDVKNGETKAIGFLVGQVMKESKGQANPELAKQLISKELGV